MYPVIIKIGAFTLHAYGVLLAMGFLLGVILAIKEARRLGIDPNLILDLAFYVLVAALLGSRLFYVLGNWEEFRDNPVDMFRFCREDWFFMAD